MVDIVIGLLMVGGSGLAIFLYVYATLGGGSPFAGVQRGISAPPGWKPPKPSGPSPEYHEAMNAKAEAEYQAGLLIRQQGWNHEQWRNHHDYNHINRSDDRCPHCKGVTK